MQIKRNYFFLHDTTPLLFPQYFPARGVGWYEKLYSELSSDDVYFTNSDCTRKDCIKYIPQINPQKIHTVYVGCNIKPVFNSDELARVKEKYDIPTNKKYVFSLCSIEPRKNLIRMVKTFVEFINKNNIDDLVLVMGGGCWREFIKKFERETSHIDKDVVIRIGYVDDEDIPVLYNGAEWFTYTSEYEGFGSPVLEAMACGCPVITSNHSSLPEVIGDAGIKIVWNSDEQHIEAYEKYYYNEGLRIENSQKGIERAKLFTWDKTVDKMLEIMIENNNS